MYYPDDTSIPIGALLDKELAILAGKIHSYMSTETTVIANFLPWVSMEDGIDQLESAITNFMHIGKRLRHYGQVTEGMMESREDQLSIRAAELLGKYSRICEILAIRANTLQRNVRGITKFSKENIFPSGLRQLPQSTPAEVLKMLQQIIKEFPMVTWNGSQRRLTVTTEPIVLTDRDNNKHEMGDFEIVLHVRSPSARLTGSSYSPAYRVYANNPNESSQEYYHPHVNSDGGVCEGEATFMITRTLYQRDLLGFFTTIMGILDNYNSRSPYQELESWTGIRCVTCNSVTDEPYHCDRIGCEATNMCENCMMFCEHCEGCFCNDHASTCDRCDSFRCHDCMRECAVCNYSICEQCALKCGECGLIICDNEDCFINCEKCGMSLCGGDSTCATEHDHSYYCKTCLQEEQENEREEQEQEQREAQSCAEAEGNGFLGQPPGDSPVNEDDLRPWPEGTIPVPSGPATVAIPITNTPGGFLPDD